MLTVAVLAYNQPHLLPDCAHSIERQPYVTEQLIIDNGSETPIHPHQYPGWTIKRVNLNVGNVMGQNLAFESATSDWVLFVANDVRLLPNCVEELWKTKELLEETTKKVGQIQPVLYKVDGSIDQAGMKWVWPGYGLSMTSCPNQPFKKVQIVPSTCYLMKKSVWNKIWFFDSSLGSSHEDVDMGIRLNRLGYSNYVAPGAKAIHLVNQTLKHTGTNPREQFQYGRWKVLMQHYRGIDYWTRKLAVQALYGVTKKSPEIVTCRRRM